MLQFLSAMRFVTALAPVADAFSGTVYPLAVKLANYARLAFVVLKGVGTTGTSTITVLASDDASHTNSTAVPFSYRRISADGKTTIGAITTVDSAGFTTTAGSGDFYIIEVDVKALAASGYAYAQLKMVEVVDSPVLGSVLAIAGDARFADSDVDIVS